uniref:Uncharacterized protein n=1 Tax=Anopheles atroparvus TaxID=41427 RepID=A0AAG5DNV4_ANOAO
MYRILTSKMHKIKKKILTVQQFHDPQSSLLIC